MFVESQNNAKGVLHSEIPMFLQFPLPRFCSSRITLHCISLAIVQEPSVEPSSMTRISSSGRVCRRRDEITLESVSDELKQGTMPVINEGFVFWVFNNVSLYLCFIAGHESLGNFFRKHVEI